MYVLDISEDVASLHIGTQPPSIPGADAGTCICALVNVCVNHVLSVVAPYKREEDHIEEWFNQMYPGTAWAMSEWYLTLESRVLQPFLDKVSQFLFEVVHRNPMRILEVDVTPYIGRVGQQVHVRVQAKILYSDNEIVNETVEEPDVSNDFDDVNSASLRDVQHARWEERNGSPFGAMNLNPTLYSVTEPQIPQFSTHHWSDEPEPSAEQRQAQRYQETISWLQERMAQRVTEARQANPWN